MWPVHTWLPDAHVEAPTAGSVILAGVLLKMGAYGFIRFSLPMLPEASAQFAPLIFVLSVVAVAYTSLVALAQEDMKKLIAYSSVAHHGRRHLGIFTFTHQGISGRAVHHAGARRRLRRALPLRRRALRPGPQPRDRALRRRRGIMPPMRWCSCSSPWPPSPARLAGFSASSWSSSALRGEPLGRAARALHDPGRCLHAAALPRVCFGRVTREDLRALLDLSPREYAVFAPLVLLTLWLGSIPQPCLDCSKPRCAAWCTRHEAR
jgi:NADH-quinone oxidoreductase subunit M